MRRIGLNKCPYCGKAYWVVKALEQALGDRLCYSFRNFPLTRSHLQSFLAAEAAEAAGAQGRYWPMHGLLFENQDALGLVQLQSYAALIGLDLDQFESDLQEHRMAERVRADFRNGIRSGVNGTPTFFVNGFRYDGPHTFDALLQALTNAAGADIHG